MKTFLRDTLFSPGKNLNFAKPGTKRPNFYNFLSEIWRLNP